MKWQHTSIRALVFTVAMAQFTIIAALARPHITSPVPWTNIGGGTTATFNWTDGGTSGITAYRLTGGYTIGSTILFDSGVLSSSTSSHTTYSLYTTDEIFIRLHYQQNGEWHSSDFCFRNQNKPQMLTPSDGGVLTGETTKFTWTANGVDVHHWWLWIGTSYNGYNLFNESIGTGESGWKHVSNLPIANNAPIYVSLWHLDSQGTWHRRTYQYSTVNDTAITNPPSGLLLGDPYTFSWDPHDSNPLYYWLYVGSEPGAFDIKNTDPGGTTYTLGGIPTDGRVVHFRLWSYHNSPEPWSYRDYHYNSFVGGYPQLVNPANGSQLSPNPDNIQTYSWTPNNGQIEEWYLYVGKSHDGNDLFSSSVVPTATQIDVPYLPQNGMTLHNKFWFKTGGNWWFAYSTVIAALTNDFDLDGIANAFDGDLDGDGTLNQFDDDIDGDEIPNATDIDNDGDGAPDSIDLTPWGATDATHHRITLTYSLNGIGEVAVEHVSQYPIPFRRTGTSSGTVEIMLEYGDAYYAFVDSDSPGGSGAISAIDLNDGPWLLHQDQVFVAEEDVDIVIGELDYEDINIAPFEILSDLDNDGMVGHGDRTLKEAGQTPDDTEYMLIDDEISNGVWDISDPNAPAISQGSLVVDDDAELLRISVPSFGKAWFKYNGILVNNTVDLGSHWMRFYSSAECKSNQRVDFPLDLDVIFDGFVYVRIDKKNPGPPNQQVFTEPSGNVLFELLWGDTFGTPLKSDRIKLYVSRHLGDPHSFHGVRDYILERNARVYMNVKEFNGEHIRWVIMRESSLTMKALDTRYVSPTAHTTGFAPFAGNPQVGVGYHVSLERTGANSPPKQNGFVPVGDYYATGAGKGGFDVIINGNYGTGSWSNNTHFKEHIGGLVQGGWHDNAISVADSNFFDAANQRPNMRIEQRTNGDIHFGSGDLGALMLGNGGGAINEALGGLTHGNGIIAFHQDGDSLEDQAFGLVATRTMGEFSADQKLVIVGASDLDLNGGWGDTGDGLEGFYKDGIIASGCLASDGAFVDPSSSVQLAYPNLRHADDNTLPYLEMYANKGKHSGQSSIPFLTYDARLYTFLAFKVESLPRP